MSRKVPPSPCILEILEHFGVRDGRKVWRSSDNKRYYTWDELHGEVEVFNKNGWHLGVVDVESGKAVKGAKKGRRLNL